MPAVTGKVTAKFFGRAAIKNIGEETGEMLKLIGLQMQRDIMISFTPDGPSSPGEPPAVDTGNLRSNVVWELDNGANSESGGDPKGAVALRVGVTSRAPYAGSLEEGTPRVAARPFLKPALDRMVGQVGPTGGKS